jgi:membrane protease YdiL (CAAX protease family)
MRFSINENRGLHAFVMVFALFGLMLASLYIFLAFIKITLPPLFGISDPEVFTTSPARMIAAPGAGLYLQVMTSIGVFIVPTILFYVIFRFDMIGEMGLNVLPSVKFWILGLVIMLLAGVFIQLLVQLNTAIPLPVWLEHLRAPQQDYDKIIDSFFVDKGFLHFIVLILAIAVLPAVGEELCFRGTIQNLVSRTDAGSIGGVIISGFVFSIFHSEFNNFLAIWCMGIVLGLIYYYSGSLWVSMAAHFLNNFLTIAGRYLYQRGVLHFDVSGTDTLPWYYTVPAGVLLVAGLVTLSRWSGKKLNGLPN